LLAEAFWRAVHLPVPNPRIPPGWAITGKMAYLEAGDTITPPPYEQPTPLGELVIVARATVSVSWGDGTSSGPYRSGGGPYPDGAVTHVYEVVGHYDVVVREDWSASWRIGAIRGELGGLHTSAAIPSFEVRQIQAVITGGN
jgi:hypothetical protein